MYYEVIPCKIFRQDCGILTYSSPTKLKPGSIVRIPLGRQEVTGIVYRAIKTVDFPTKPITKLLYDTPLPRHLTESLKWLSDYYLAPLPQVAALALPVGIEKRRRGTVQRDATNFALSEDCVRPTGSTLAKSARNDGPDERVEESAKCSIPLNHAQRSALRCLRECPSTTKLLLGITGSGKTNIYLELTKEILKNNRSVILLVPEIALTSQLVQNFKQFNPKILHSRLTESERHQIWEQILTANSPEVIIGARSALFAPVKDLGLILIDEAHEPAYYQENTPKYSAIRLASYMAKIGNATCILGSATPNVTDYYLAQKSDACIKLTEKAKKTAIKPKITVIDLKNRENFTKNRYFSTQLLNKIEENLKNHHQTLIFHNRRGSAPLTLCEKCGWQALCPTCFLPLTLHTDAYELLCHTCGYKTQVPLKCPSCGALDVIHKGFGTKLLEQELKKLFKNAKIARFDADNAKQDTLNSKYQEVKAGEYDIIIGTQTVAKGLDLPNLATVGVVQADAGLSLPDFASEERTFHLLAQVLGRVGRGHLTEANAFIQTYEPDHPAIISAINEDYQTFANYLLKKRTKSTFPPFKYLAKVSLTYKTEQTTIKNIQKYHELLKKNPKITVSTPIPAFHEQSQKGYTWELILKSSNRGALLFALKTLPKSPNLHLAIDPPSLLGK